jgi:hypothetical protein
LKLLDLGRFVDRDLIIAPHKGKMQVSLVKDQYSAKQTSKEGVAENIQKELWDVWYENHENLSAQHEAFFKSVSKAVASSFSSVFAGRASLGGPAGCVCTFKLMFALNSELREFTQMTLTKQRQFEFCVGKDPDGSEFLELIVSASAVSF